MITSRIETDFKIRAFTLVCALVLIVAQAQLSLAQTITVQVDKPGAKIAPTLFGLFFEDINFGADGGLYPERVKNRSFEFPEALMGWRKIEGGKRILKVMGWREVDGGKGTLKVLQENPLNANNSHYLRMEIGKDEPRIGIANEGFRGLGIEKGDSYSISVYARRMDGAAAGLRVTLEDEQGNKLGSAQLAGLTTQWKKYSAVVRATGTSLKARLNLFAEGRGTVDVDMVSLFPKATWKNRPNGLRADLVKLLHDMKPGFLRFPGGCIVEGRYLTTRYQWKTTVGDTIDRPLLINRWNDEFKHRPAPDYFQSFGLGFYEYFLLSEDIGASPLPILNCGMACQFNSNELVPLDQLDPYVQDALDLIEFANGPLTSRWGALRAQMGHPAPFNLKMIGVGNEQWGPQYVERYKLFAKVLKQKHPEISLVAAAGPSPNNDMFKYLWSQWRQLNPDLVDEHYYMSPKWFRDNVGRYDDYPRTGPKVFAGEYAAQSDRVATPNNRNNWECAMSEAAFMTGLERNADVVKMSSYAPLLGHVDGWQWTPNLIWFDNLRVYGTPNYYVQKLFGTNRGATILPVMVDGSAKNGQGDLFTSASFDDRTGEVILKAINTASTSREVHVSLAGAKAVARSGKAIVLASSDLKAENSFAEPTKVAPVEKPFKMASSEFSYTLAPYSLTILRIGAR
jgi:alpha-N-arabinofuranosidase